MRRFVTHSDREQEQVVNRQFHTPIARLHPASSLSPRARLLRWVFILLGLSLCLYAANLSRARVRSAWGDSSLSSMPLPSSPASVPSNRRVSADPGAPDAAIFDFQLKPLRARLTRLSIETRVSSDNASAELVGEARFTDDAGREQRLPAADIAAIAPPDAALPPRDLARRLQEQADLLLTSLPVPSLSTSSSTNPQPPAGSSLSGIIELTDGQLWPGSLAPQQPPGGQALLWRSSRLGPRTIPLELIRRISFLSLSPEPSPLSLDLQPAQAQDLLLMRNGDRILGFLDSFLPDPDNPDSTLPVALIDLPDKKSLRVSLADVREIRLANPPEFLPGLDVFFTDGSLIRARRISLNPDSARYDLELARSKHVPLQDENDVKLSSDSAIPTRLFSVDPAEIRAIITTPSRLLPLSRLNPVSQAPSPDRRWTRLMRRAEPYSPDDPQDPARFLNLDPLVFPGPMIVEWVLPVRSQRLVATAVLPPAAQQWGDCELLVSFIPPDSAGVSGSSEAVVARVQLSSSNPTAAVNLPLLSSPPPASKAGSASPPTIPEGSRLRIEIRSGQNGPIQDQIVLMHACLIQSY